MLSKTLPALRPPRPPLPTAKLSKQRARRSTLRHLGPPNAQGTTATHYNQVIASNSHPNSHSNTNDSNNNNNSFFRRSPQVAQDEPPLPPDWEVAIDPKNKLPYYYNRVLNVTQWNRPSNPPGENPFSGGASGPFNEPKIQVSFVDPVSMQRSLQEQNIRKQSSTLQRRTAEDLQQRQQQQQQDQDETVNEEKDSVRRAKPDEEKQLTKVFAKVRSQCCRALRVDHWPQKLSNTPKRYVCLLFANKVSNH